VLAIVALFGGMLYGWSWLDPVMGIVGAVLVAVWAKGLIRRYQPGAARSRDGSPGGRRDPRGDRRSTGAGDQPGSSICTSGASAARSSRSSSA
jgi:hypothetical protein